MAAAVMLREAGYQADAVIFGPPACVEPMSDTRCRSDQFSGPDGTGQNGGSPPPRLCRSLRKHVTTIIVDCDIVPRLSKASLRRLLAPRVSSPPMRTQALVYHRKRGGVGSCGG